VAVSALRLLTVSVLGAAASARLAGAPGVKVTCDVALRLPTVAVTTAVPGNVELSVAVATPLVVTLVIGDALPKLVEKLTTMPLATGLPNWSVTVAVSALRLPTGSVLGAAASATLAGGPAVKVTGFVTLTLLTVAVTVARPAMVELSVAVATPLVVTLVIGDMLPKFVVKLTTVPLTTGLPSWSVTVMVSVLRLPTSSVLGAATNVMLGVETACKAA